MNGLGIDFGTTNSAIAAVTEAGGAPRLCPLPDAGGGRVPTWRTVLYFEPTDAGPPRVSAGAAAIDRYQASLGQGRFIQSMKSHLASELFTTTHVLGRRYAIEDLVAVYLRELRGAAGIDRCGRVVVGRPVRYWGARDEADDARAVERMRRALETAGFGDVVFEYEPVAAAYRYASRLDHEELVMVADFGGGTSDFSLLRVGGAGGPRVLATDGVAVSGDAFDGRIIDAVVSPRLGKGSTYDVGFGKTLPVPPWLYSRLRRWHHLSFLKAPDTLALLERIETGTSNPQPIRALRDIIDDELGLPLHRSVEASKMALSNQPSANLSFAETTVPIDEPITRAAFDEWIAEDLAAIAGSIDRVLAKAALAPTDIDHVFVTGGTAFVPAVRGLLAARFGADRLAGGDELTSVAWGLAAAAATGGGIH